MKDMGKLSKKIIVVFLVVMMTFTGIAPSVMSISYILMANPEQTEEPPTGMTS